MSDSAKSTPLDYRSLAEAKRKYVEDAFERHWRRIRILYRSGLFVVLLPAILFFVSNRVMFGKFTPLTPADFVPRARRYIPMIVALKEYRRDHGHLPGDLHELIPKYLPDDPGSLGFIDPADNAWGDFGGYHPSQIISYQFTPGHERWTVFGLFANGPIPLPTVTIPATRPAMHP